jgi:hypothetical protein
VNIYYFGVGSIDNIDSSVDGGKYIRLPLITELVKAKHTVNWVGFTVNNIEKNNYLNLIGLHERDYHMSVANMINDLSTSFMNAEKTHINMDVVKSHVEKNPGILFIELRPNIKKEGYNFENEWNVQTELIEVFHQLGYLVFCWDQDVWAEQIPAELRNKMILLRSYFDEVPNFDKQELYLYAWFTPTFEKKLDELCANKIFDVTYCGNVYGRRNEFLEYFEYFEKQNKAVCIQGNWLRKKYDDRDFSLDNFPHFMFFGKTPHWSTLPSIAMSNSVVQFSNPDQQRVGLPTARLFETLVGKSVVFCSDKIQHIDKLVPEELITTSGKDLIEKWIEIDKNKRWNELRLKFEKKLKIFEHSYAYRCKQLEQYVQKYQ